MLEVHLTSMFIERSQVYPELNGCHLPKAWRVGWKGTTYSIPVAFARQSDAEAAVNALTAAGIVAPEDFITAGRARFEQVMIEALNW